MRTIAGYEVNARVTETTKKILRALRKHKVVIFQRDDSLEGMQTVRDLKRIAGCIGLLVFGEPYNSDHPYKVAVVDEDRTAEVGQYQGKKVLMPD